MECYYDVAENCHFLKIRMVSRYVTNMYTKALKEVNLTPVQYSMLTAISILKESNINTLSSSLKMDRTTINRNLKPLIRDGLVYINESGDKRERIVQITKQGSEAYQEGYKNWKDVQEKLKATIGDSLWNEMNDALDKVIQVIVKQ